MVTNEAVRLRENRTMLLVALSNQVGTHGYTADKVGNIGLRRSSLTFGNQFVFSHLRHIIEMLLILIDQ